MRTTKNSAQQKRSVNIRCSEPLVELSPLPCTCSARRDCLR